jgi:hypothetical protein
LFSISLSSIVGQTSKTDLEKKFGPLVTVEIPNEAKSKVVSTTYEVVERYIESKKGYVLFVGNRGGFTNIYHSAHLVSNPNLVIDLAKSPYRDCEDKPSDVGVLLCMVNRLSEKIASWFD